MAKTISEKELEILFGDNVGKVEILNKEYPIYPFNVKQTAMVVKELGMLLPILSSNVDENGIVQLTQGVLIGLITESIDSVVKIVAEVLKLDVAFVEQLDIDSLIRTVLEIIRVNKSFFEQRVRSTLEEAGAILPMQTVSEPSEN